MRYCIKGGRIVDPAGDYIGVGDLLIDDGKISAVSRELSPENAKIIRAEGKLIFPGLIDLHCHLREPGREDEETILTGARAALVGGFTAVSCMANTNPVADRATVISYVLTQAQRAAAAKVLPVGAISKGLKGEELAEMGEMADAGAVAFSDDGHTLLNSSLLKTAFEYVSLFNMPLLLHQEDPNLAGNGVMHEGYWSTVLGVPGIPDIAESSLVARDLQIAAYTGGKIHLCHVSAAKTVQLIREAKVGGVQVSAEATPHHLALTDAALENFNSVFRVNPPLRSAADQKALRIGLRDGVIDAIATDHAPHSLEEKHREFSLAAPGMTGLETALAVIWTELVRTGELTETQLIEKMAVNPARILNIGGGSLKPGNPADLLIFDPDYEWEVAADRLISKSRNNPFIGRKLFGKTLSVWVDGNLRYFNESFT